LYTWLDSCRAFGALDHENLSFTAPSRRGGARLIAVERYLSAVTLNPNRAAEPGAWAFSRRKES
jgi:hypothetical protein